MARLGALVTLACLVWLVRSMPTDVPAIILVRAWLGIAFVVMLARVIGPHLRWLAMLGHASMAIFAIHTIITALLRAILTKLVIHDPGAVLAVCGAGALLFPVLIAKVATRNGIEGLLRFGKSERSAKRPSVLTSPTAS